MPYRDDVTGEVEHIWNSRDGVTPYVISSRAGNAATHVFQDDYLPGYVPAVGSRVFVNLTRARAEHKAEIWAQRSEARTDEYTLANHMKQTGKTRAELVAEQVESLLDPHLGGYTPPQGYEGGQPDVVEVTEALRAQLKAKATERVGRAQVVVAGGQNDKLRQMVVEMARRAGIREAEVPGAFEREDSALREADHMERAQATVRRIEASTKRCSEPGRLRPGDVVDVNGVSCRVMDVRRSKVTLYMVST